MTKKGFGKEKKFILVLALVSILSILTISFISAADVAYIYKSKPKIDNNIISVFNEMNLTVETISEKNLTQNFSKFKFIFVGNERFKNYNKIPINEYPSIITNYYHGFQWGLTDNDGISKLAATGPLSVVKNGQIIQVYTQARYDTRPISIPYFYLGTLNKVPEMQKIAGTYTGDNFDLGDVISFGPAGIHLINGKFTKGNMCYYGIVESKYWTPEARQLFKDCVGMVALTCSKDSDCGNDTTGGSYCSGNSIYQNTTHFTCQNPGTVQSKCVSNIIVNSVTNCTTNQTCQNGQCLNVHCKTDSDCGTNGFDLNSLICQNNTAFGNFTTYKCINPNTPLSNCTSSSNLTLKEVCSEECLNGICIGTRTHNLGFIDFTNSINKIQLEFLNGTNIPDQLAVLNCGTTIKGKVRIQNKGNFSENATVNANIGNISFNLNDITNILPGDFSDRSILSPYLNLTLLPGIYNLTFNVNLLNDSNLQDNTAIRQLQINCFDCNLDNDCPTGKYCINHSCVPIICFNNSQCGTNALINGLFCQNNNVFHNYLTYICNNPGTEQSFCSNSTTPQLNKTCSSSQICTNGECLNITCSTNSQCGTDGFVGNKFCSNGDSYQNYTQYTCNNPNTPNSSCSSQSAPRLFQTCENSQCMNGVCINITCSNNSQCDDSNLYTFDQCNNPGTQSSYCSHTLVNCVTNNDCGITGFVGTEFCSGNSVFKNFQNSTCINPASILSYCDISLGPRLLTNCGTGTCTNGTCIVSICVDNDHDTYDTCSPGQPGDDGKPIDCNDNNPNIHPNAAEICNGIDDNCDGIIDENNGNCGNSQICSSGQCIPITCSMNSQCGTNGFIGNLFCINGDIYQNFITFNCNNPGTANSYCSNSTSNQIKTDCPSAQTCNNGVCAPIVCSNNSGCGTDGFIGSPTCQNGNVFQNYIIWTCNNPGTAQSSCLNSTNSQIKQTCQFGCTNGTCIDSTCVDNDHDTYDICSPGQPGDDGKLIDCNDNNANIHPNAIEICNGIDDDCDGIIDENNGNCGNSQICSSGSCVPIVCYNNSGCNDANAYTQDICNNPGTILSSCSHLPITCISGSDCGTNGLVNGLFCLSGDSFQNFINYSCNFPGTANSYCSNTISPQLKTDCNNNQVCSNGACLLVTCFNDNDCNDGNTHTIDHCLNPATAQSVCSHTPINCISNTDCGTNGFTGGQFCQGNSIFQNFITYTCTNPGTDTSSCNSNILPQLKQNCPQNQVCSSGSCVNVACFSDNDCNDGNTYTQDKCNNPGTIQSSCSHLPITCLANTDCGTNGFINGLFCQSGDVFQNFITYTCNSPGTSNSFCINNIAPQLKTDCPSNQVCSNGACNPVTCFNDNDCNDGNSNTVDHCLNPGTVQSSCTHDVIVCTTNSQCGTDIFTGSPFCQSGNVFQNFITYTCNNPGTTQSSCTSSSTSQIKTNCPSGQTCSNGACVSVTCTLNSQCGTDGFTGNPFCQSGNVFQNFVTYTCNNPGTPQSLCTSSSTPQIKTNCPNGQTCSNGQCAPVTCTTNSGCGTDGFTGNPFCQSGNVFQNFVTYTCNNPGTPQSSCSNSNVAQIKTNCPSGQTCSNGQCAPVTCTSNSQCGTDGFSGNPFCQSGNVFQNFVTWTCNNPGTTQSSCSSSTTTQIKTNCPSGQTCNNGVCVNVVCSTNSQCGADGFSGNPFCQNGNVFQNFITWTCNNPGTAQSSCSSSTATQIKTNCPSGQTCTNGQCAPVTCTSNSQCGTDGFSGNPFCQNGNVFQNFISWTCNNPGTAQSSCSSSTATQIKQTCPAGQTCNNGVCAPVTCTSNSQCGTDGFSGNPFCQSGNVFQNFITWTCNNPGTVFSSCSSSTISQIKQTCPTGQTCSNGACINVVCSTNSQCGTDGFSGNPFCQSGNVFQNFITYTCNNPGTAFSSCSSSTATQIKQTCPAGQTCSNGACVPVTCSSDSDCDDSNPNTIDHCINPGTPQSTCTHTPITCSTNSQCGANGLIGDPFCQNGNVFQNFITFTCNNPGTAQSSCTSATVPQLKQTCLSGQTCSNGACINVVCSTNSQCGTDAFTGSPFCQNGNVFQNFITFTCNNPGTAQSSCTSATVPQLKQTCLSGQTCSNGACINVVCSTNSQCGTDGFVGNPFCINGDVYQGFISFNCNNPGTANSFCSNTTTNQIKTDCPSTQGCSNGQCSPITCFNDSDCNDNNQNTFDQCLNPGTTQSSCTHTAIVCFNNSQCGTDAFTGDPFCQGNDVFQNFITNICNNPGTISSSCTISSAPRLKETCSNTCSNGNCTNQDNCNEANNILNTIYSNVNGGTDFFTLDQARTTSFCNNNDILLAGAGTMAQCSDSNTLACNFNTNYEFNGPVSPNGWQSFYSAEEQNRFYDNVREEAICLPSNVNASKYFSIYIRNAGSGGNIFSLDQSNTIALCDSGDKVISGGGYAPFCDANNPACGKKQYLEFNGPTSNGNQEGWKINYDLGGNEIYDTVQTFAVCLKKTALFDEKFKIETKTNEGISFYNLDQSRTNVLCDSGDIAIGGGGNAAYCDNGGSSPACNKTQFLEFNGKIVNGNIQGWQTFFDVTGNQIYDTQKVSVICLGLADSCIA